MQENTETDIVETEAEKNVEENPLLVAQRFLNISRQIHIFKQAKRTQFDNELLEMSDKVKKLLANIPGGFILIEHILELEEKNNRSTKLSKALLAQRKSDDSFDIVPEEESKEIAPVSGELKLSSDFADVLAKSLATAFGNNAFPQMVGGPVAGGLAVGPDGKPQNTQNNVAATTVNNIHVDYSVFQNLADAINKTNAQTHDDFMKMVDTLSQNFNPTIVKTDGIPLSAITSSITQALKETSRQQIEEMKIFSQTLTEAILGNKNTLLASSIKDKYVSGRGLSTDIKAGDFKSGNSKTTSTSITPAASGKSAPPEKQLPDNDRRSRVLDKLDKEAKTQTVSVVNRTINPYTEASTVQKTSYSIPADTEPVDIFNLTDPTRVNFGPRDNFSRVQDTLSSGYGAKPFSLSNEEEDISPFTPPKPKKPAVQPQPAYTEYELDENLNMHQQPSYGEQSYYQAQNNETFEEEWEYVDEYGNPVSGSEEEWEYVDEYGNPVSGAGEEWEYEYVTQPIAPVQQATTTPVSQPVAPVQSVQPITAPVPQQPAVPEKNAQPPVAEQVPQQSNVTTTQPEQPAIATSAQPEVSAPQPIADVNLAQETPQDSPNTAFKDAFKDAFEAKGKKIFSSIFKKKDKTEKQEKEDKKEADLSADTSLKATESAEDINKETKKEEIKEEKSKKHSVDNIFAAAFKKSKDKDKDKDKEISKEEKNTEKTKPQHLSSKDLLAAAFAGKSKDKEKIEIPKIKEAKKESVDDVLAKAIKKSGDEPKKEQKMGGLLAEAFKNDLDSDKEKSKKPISSKDLLAQAFGGSSKASLDANEESKKESADDTLAKAFTKPEKETKIEGPKKTESTDDILAAAFGKKKDNSKAEEPAVEKKPKLGGLLAEAFQEVQGLGKNKPISSKDLLAQAFKNSSKTPSNSSNEEPKKDSADDVLAKAFANKPKEETKVEAPVVKEEPKKDSADDVLAKAFANKPKEEAKVEAPVAKDEPKKDSADDVLAKAFANKPKEEAKIEAPVVKEEPKKDSADDVLAKAFANKPKEEAKVEAPVVKDEPKKDSADDVLAKAFANKPKEEAKIEAPIAKEEPKEVVTTPKQNSIESVLANAFAGKPKEEPKEEGPKPNSIDSVLANAFAGKPKEEVPVVQQTPKTNSIESVLAKAFADKPKEEQKAETTTTQSPKQNSIESVLANAFAGKPKEEPKKEGPEPNSIESVLASAFADKPKPTATPKPSSIDSVLANAFGGKPKEENTEENKKTSVDPLSAAFSAVANDTKKDDGIDDALMKAFKP